MGVVGWTETLPHVVTTAFNAHVGIIIPNLQPLYYVAKDTCYWVGKSIHPLINNKSLYVSTVQNLVLDNITHFYHTHSRNRDKSLPTL